MKKLQKSIRAIAVAMSMGATLSLTSCDVMLGVAGGMAEAMLTGMAAGGTSALTPTYSTGMMGASTSNDPQYQAYINYKRSGLPGASTISYDDFKKANARAAANGYQVGNSSSSSKVSSSNASSNSTSSKSKKCGFCGGRGWNVEYAAGYGLAKQEYCNQCGKTMMSNHYHATCQKCKGTGIEQ